MTMRIRASLLAGVLLAACAGDDGPAAPTDALVPRASAFSYRSVTRGDVVLSGAMYIGYAGADSVSGEILAADPVGTPYFDGHFVGTRQSDGSYLFEAPKADREPTASRYVHRVRRTRAGYTCELRDQRQGTTVTTVCALTDVAN